MVDVAVIGGGVVGCAVAELLSRYELDICVIERETDVAAGTTKANSGIVHAGYDAPTGSLMARLNLEGSKCMADECRRLDVGYRQIGSLVLSLREEDDAMLAALLERGQKNGVDGLNLLPAQEVRRREPALSPSVRGALHAPTAAIVDPFLLCIAYAEVAARNGVRFCLEHEVRAIRRTNRAHVITAGNTEIEARWIINAAGVHADQIQEMAGEREFSIVPVRGEYYMMDRQVGDLVHSVIFQCPGPEGKGVLVSPTVHGNLIVGPNAEDIENKDDMATTWDGQTFVRQTAAKSVPGIDYRFAIRNFSGVRAHSDAGDFIIGLSKTIPQFLNLAGICSPGLTAAPAIARMAVDLLQSNGLGLQPKTSPVLERRVVRMKPLSVEEKRRQIQRDPAYGRVLCRCETVTEGEIRDALRREPIPRTVDAIKKRVTAGMGRCQGGFCLPRVMEMISKELGIAQEDIELGKEGSQILTGETK